ncbi:MAG: type IV secretion protein IcmC, partial [bacterium]|nr:type IV secretion protein IcmC [bacterium]
RGCVLVVHSSEPGTQDGPKGLVFIIAGILALNFDNTIAMINSVLEHLISWTLKLKASQGY